MTILGASEGPWKPWRCLREGLQPTAASLSYRRNLLPANCSQVSPERLFYLNVAPEHVSDHVEATEARWQPAVQTHCLLSWLLSSHCQERWHRFPPPFPPSLLLLFISANVFFEDNCKAESRIKWQRAGSRHGPHSGSRDASLAPRQTTKPGDMRDERASRKNRPSARLLPRRRDFDFQRGLTWRWGSRLLTRVGLLWLFRWLFGVLCLVFSITVLLNTPAAQTNPLSSAATALWIRDMIHQQFRKLRPKHRRRKKQILQLNISFQISEVRLFQQTRDHLSSSENTLV